MKCLNPLRIQPRRICRILSLLTIGSLLSGLAFAQNFTVGNYMLVTKERVGRAEFNYTYRADLTNAGDALQNVTATVTSTSPDTVVVDESLRFGDVAAGGTATSTDTFTIRHNRLTPFDFAALVWEIVQPMPPVLEAIENQTVALGSTLTLSFPASDPNGDPLTFSAARCPCQPTLI